MSPREEAMNICDQASKKNEKYYDAMEQGYASDTAGGRTAETSMASADAEVTGPKEEKEEASRTTAGRGRKRFKFEAGVRIRLRADSGRACCCCKSGSGCARRDANDADGGGELGLVSRSARRYEVQVLPVARLHCKSRSVRTRRRGSSTSSTTGTSAGT